MKVLGIDPGTRIVGYGIVEDKNNKLIALSYGAIYTPNKVSLGLKLKKIHDELNKIIEEYSPEVVALENVFYGKNFKSALKIGEARGAILLTIAKCNLEVYEYDPTKIKKSVCGLGRAHKIQIQHIVKNLLNLPSIPTPNDAGDALAIAICHINSNKFQNLIK